MFFVNRFYVIEAILHANYIIYLLETLLEQYTKMYRKISLY